MKILSIGLDRALFDKQSDTFWRVSTYASWFEKYTVIVTTLKNESISSFQSKTLKVIPTNSISKLFYPLDALKIAVKEKTFDLVTVQDPFICAIAGILIKYALGIPLNIQIHSEFFNTAYFRRESHLNVILYYIGLFTLHFADSVRTRNKRIKNDIIKRFPKLRGKVNYVGMPINDIFLTPLSEQRRDKNLIISIGRDVPQKNFSLLEDVAEIVKSKYLGVRFEMIFGGKKPLEIKELLDKAGVFVLSSNHEGWGLVILEALSRGCPVVMTDTGCAGEIVIDGKTGYVAPVGNAKILAEKIIKTLDNYNNSLKMTLFGRKLVKKDVDLNNIKNQLNEMYKATIFLPR